MYYNTDCIVVIQWIDIFVNIISSTIINVMNSIIVNISINKDKYNNDIILNMMHV